MDQADPSRSTTCGYKSVNDSPMAASIPSLLLCDFYAIAICTFLSQVYFMYEPVLARPVYSLILHSHHFSERLRWYRTYRAVLGLLLGT